MLASRGHFLTQGSNQRLLQWQVESLPLSHQGGALLKQMFFPARWKKGGFILFLTLISLLNSDFLIYWVTFGQILQNWK